MQLASEESVPREPISDALGPVQDGPEVTNEALATTMVEWVTVRPGEMGAWDIAGVWSRPDSEQEEKLLLRKMPVYIVYTDKDHVDRRWKSTIAGHAGLQVQGVSIARNTREMCYGRFSECETLRYVTFGAPSSLETVEVGCFEDTAVQGVSIPDSVCELEEASFKGCSYLRYVTFGPSSRLKKIDYECFGVFEGVNGWRTCGIAEIHIPDSVLKLSGSCFRACKNLRCVTFGASSRLEKIGKLCFCASGLEKFEMPVSVRKIGGGAFAECPLTEGVICREGCGVRAFGGLVLSADCKRCYCSYGSLTSVCIPDSVCEIWDCCFQGCESLESVTFGPSSCLEMIGAEAFGGIPGLTDYIFCGLSEIRVPDSVRELCDACFRGCQNLVCVTFSSSSSLETIGVDCFESTQVEELLIPDGVCELCDLCFKRCDYLVSVTFGASSRLERIGAFCFYKCGLEKFEIPASVRKIGGGAFAECPLTEGVICCEGCGVRAFDGLVLSVDCKQCYCSYGILTSVCIPDSVCELCDSCFQGCESLESVTFGSSSCLERIGADVFGTFVEMEESTPCGLTEINIPDSVRELSDGCFQGCQNLYGVNISPSSSLERIGVSCFEGTPIEMISIPDGVRELCDCCFKGCRSLGYVEFGSSPCLERIGADAFGFSDHVFGYSPCGLVEISIPDSVRELCDGCFKRCQNLVCVTFGSSPSLERMGVSCFERTAIEEMSIPDSVRELCDGCFKDCDSLVCVEFGSSPSLERIGASCFECTAIEEISIPDSVRELCDGCFKDCDSLVRVEFGSSSRLERIGAQCFAGCNLINESRT